MFRNSLLPLAALVLAGCGRDNSTDSITTRNVTLPDGYIVRAELKVTNDEMARGMMYRDALPDGQGMLFIHGQPGHSAYWMANCKIPLDIIWMDASHKVVEISANTPPCPGGGNDCPTYGGHELSQFVLELGTGQAASHRVSNGALIAF